MKTHQKSIPGSRNNKHKGPRGNEILCLRDQKRTKSKYQKCSNGKRGRTCSQRDKQNQIL